jgi:hypothetical protein
VLTASRFDLVLGLLQAHGRLWGAARSALVGLVASGLQMEVRLFELLPCFGNRLVSGPLFGGQWGAHSFHQFMLDMERIWRVMSF